MTKTTIGCVLIHFKGTNPYSRDYNPNRIGDVRVAILKKFRDTGTLHEAIALWSDSEKVPITNPEQVDWSGLRD